MHKLCDKYDTKFDLAFFQHSAYVLDDDEYIRLLMDLKENGVKEIIDIRATIPILGYPRIILGAIKRIILQKLFHVEHSLKFHGYQRSSGSIKYMYSKAGWKVVEITKLGSYNFVATLRPQMS